jgi:hypothetical protein
LTSAIHGHPLVDGGKESALLCDYTGKEVVECKVQMVVVEGATDQVRWLRLRAVALSGVPLQAERPGGTTVRTLPVSKGYRLACRSRRDPELPKKRPRRVTTSWSIPTVPPDGA